MYWKSHNKPFVMTRVVIAITAEPILINSKFQVTQFEISYLEHKPFLLQTSFSNSLEQWFAL